MSQSKNALCAAQGLFGVFTAAGLGLHDPKGGRTDDEGTLQNAIQVLIDDGDVLLRPMHAAGQALRALFGPRMGGNQVPCMKDLHRTGGEAHIHSLANETIRHGVIRPGNLDVIIGVHLGLAPLAELIRLRRQRPSALRVPDCWSALASPLFALSLTASIWHDWCKSSGVSLTSSGDKMPDQVATS